MIKLLIKYPIFYLPIFIMIIMPLFFRKLKKRVELKEYLIIIFLILVVENILDYFFTMTGIYAGCVEEANPAVNILIQNGSFVFLKVAISIYILIVGILVIRKLDKFTKRSEIGLVFAASVYTALMAYHLIIQYYCF